MTSYVNDILDALEGDTPRKKYESLLRRNSKLAMQSGRIDFLIGQIEIIKDNPYTDPTTKMWCDSVLKTVKNNPI